MFLSGQVGELLPMLNREGVWQNQGGLCLTSGSREGCIQDVFATNVDKAKLKFTRASGC